MNLSRDKAWAFLLLWLSEERHIEPLLERHAQRLINASIASVSEEARAEIYTYFKVEGGKKTESIYQAKDEDLEIPEFLRKLAD